MANSRPFTVTSKKRMQQSEKMKQFMSKNQLVKITVITIIMTMTLLTLSACTVVHAPGGQNHHNHQNQQTRTVTDVFGRNVEIPIEVESIIVIGVGAPRIATYLDVMDMLVGIESHFTSEINVLRDYHPVIPARLLTLPIVGAGGGSGENNGFAEEIIMISPDVIIAGFDKGAAEELQSQTGIPVVSVRHTTGLANESFKTAVRVFAEVAGAEDRAEEILAYIEELKNDLNRRTMNVPYYEKLSAYAGAVTWNGRRGFAGTYSHFGIFEAINAINVAHVTTINGFYEASFESIIIWDPDVIFLDPGNMDLVSSEFAANPNFFNSLRAIREGRVYSMPSFNHAGTNITYAFINAYFAGTILFPNQFADINIEDKAGEILTKFLGRDTFDIMQANGLFYGQIIIE